MNISMVNVEELVNCIRTLNVNGHSPATSTNYSFRDNQGRFWVSRSGIDKAQMLSTDFIEMSSKGIPQPPFEAIVPSAETGIHCALYELFPETNVILHSHDPWSIIQTHGKKSISFEGYELQKAFPSIQTHEGIIHIPVIPNSQDMAEIKEALSARKEELKFQVFMIEKHGFYSWANSLFEAKRILEAFSYLCFVDHHLNK